VFVTGLVSLPVSGALLLTSGFFTSGEVFAFGEPAGLDTGDAEGAVVGVAAGVEAGGVVGGLLSTLLVQAPKIAVEAARTVAKTIDLLIVLFFHFIGRIRGSFRQPTTCKSHHRTSNRHSLTIDLFSRFLTAKEQHGHRPFSSDQ